MNPGRALGAASTAAGIVLLAWPHRVGETVTSSEDAVPAPWVVRVLGGRMVVQGVAEMIKPDQAVLVLSAITDALHSASMFALAAFDSTYRRPALTSACVAAANASGNAVVSRRT